MRRVRGAVVALVLFAAVFVAADRVAAVVAEHAIAGRVAAADHLPSRPAVTVRGFPFLTQLVSGNYRQVDATIGRVRSGGVVVDNLHADCTGVRAPLADVLGRGGPGITLAHVTAAGTIPFVALRRRLPAGLRAVPDGSGLRLSGTLRYLGVGVPVATVVSLAVHGGAIVVTPGPVTVRGVTIPGSAAASRFGFDVPVTGLPLHLRLTSVAVTRSGVHVAATAADVHVADTA